MKNTNTIKKLTAALLALTLVLGLAACTTAHASSMDKISVDGAKELALKQLEATEAKFIEHETELDDGKYEFEIIADGAKYDIEVSAATGKVLEIDRDGSLPAAPAETAPAPTAPTKLTIDEAKALILDYLGTSDAKFIERETERDDNEYEFEVITGSYEYDFEVNIFTGKITEIDRDLIRTAPAETTPPETAPPETVPAAAAPAEAAPTRLTASDAKALVLSHLGTSDAKFIERETELDDGEYEFEVIAGDIKYDFEVGIYTGKVRETDREYLAPAAETISMDEAKALVLAHLGDSSAAFTDAEMDDGVYEFEVRSGRMEYDYKVDAATGKILKAERDD